MKKLFLMVVTLCTVTYMQGGPVYFTNGLQYPVDVEIQYGISCKNVKQTIPAGAVDVQINKSCATTKIYLVIKLPDGTTRRAYGQGDFSGEKLKIIEAPKYNYKGSATYFAVERGSKPMILFKDILVNGKFMRDPDPWLDFW